MNEAERNKVIDEVIALLDSLHDPYEESEVGLGAIISCVEQMKREGGAA